MTRDDFLKLMYMRSTGTGYVVNCDTYELKFVNPPMLRVVGKGFDSYHHQICYEFLYNRSSPCDYCKMHKTKLGQASRWYHESHFSGRPLLMRDFKVDMDGELLFLPTAYNIPKEMEELQLLTNSMTAEQLLTACAKTLTNAHNTMETLLEEITTFYGGSCGFLFYQDSDSDTFSLQHFYEEHNTLQQEIQENTPSFPFHGKEPWVETLTKHPYTLIDKYSTFYFPSPISAFCQGELLLTYVKIDQKILGVLGIQDVTENKESFHLMPTIVSFLRNHFAIQNTITDLESQKEACEMVLRSVQTLVAEDDLSQGINHLLADLSTYFHADRSFLLRNREGKLEIAYDYVAQKEVFAQIRLTKDSLHEFNLWFDSLGTHNILLLRNVQEELGTISPKVAEILKQDKVESLLGIRLQENGTSTYFIMMDNPRIHRTNNTVLHSVSQFVESHLAKDLLLKKLSQLSYSDSLTGLYNRNFYQQYLEHWRQNTQGKKFENAKYLGILFADVNGLKKANDNFGHELGDILLKWTAHFLKTETHGVIFRLGGDEFLCFLEEYSFEEFHQKKEDILTKLATYGEKHLSIGWHYGAESHAVEDAVKKADFLMYEEKQKFYQEQRQDTRSVYESLQTFKENVLKLESAYSEHGGQTL